MNRLLIICEGPTEVEFCKDVLSPYFLGKNIIIQAPLIKKSHGGIVSWESLKTQITTHLKQESNVYVTTLIDYYGILEKHKFPNWKVVEATLDRNDRMDILEANMLLDIDATYSSRFIPYVQLHEFEGLLFNNIEVFRQNFTSQEANLDKIANIIDDHPNPELINNGRDTAPSKRLQELVLGYNKVVHGAILAQEIGISNLRTKSFRFDIWIDKLIKKCNPI